MKKKELMFIGSAAKATGLSVRQIRFWSNQGYILPNSITQSGDIKYRLYGPEEINRMKQIKSYLDEGFTLKASVAKTKSNIGRNE